MNFNDISRHSGKKQSNSVDCFCQIIKLFDISLIENRCGNMQSLLFFLLSFPGVLLTYANLKFEVESFSVFFPGVLPLIYREILW